MIRFVYCKIDHLQLIDSKFRPRPGTGSSTPPSSSPVSLRRAALTVSAGARSILAVLSPLIYNAGTATQAYDNARAGESRPRLRW
jgi:hypothetical protein